MWKKKIIILRFLSEKKLKPFALKSTIYNKKSWAQNSNNYKKQAWNIERPHIVQTCGQMPSLRRLWTHQDAWRGVWCKFSSPKLACCFWVELNVHHCLRIVHPFSHVACKVPNTFFTAGVAGTVTLRQRRDETVRKYVLFPVSCRREMWQLISDWLTRVAPRQIKRFDWLIAPKYLKGFLIGQVSFWADWDPYTTRGYFKTKFIFKIVARTRWEWVVQPCSLCHCTCLCLLNFGSWPGFSAVQMAVIDCHHSALTTAMLLPQVLIIPVVSLINSMLLSVPWSAVPVSLLANRFIALCQNSTKMNPLSNAKRQLHACHFVMAARKIWHYLLTIVFETPTWWTWDPLWIIPADIAARILSTYLNALMTLTT